VGEGGAAMGKEKKKFLEKKSEKRKKS